MRLNLVAQTISNKNGWKTEFQLLLDEWTHLVEPIASYKVEKVCSEGLTEEVDEENIDVQFYAILPFIQTGIHKVKYKN